MTEATAPTMIARPGRGSAPRSCGSSGASRRRSRRCTRSRPCSLRPAARDRPAARVSRTGVPSAWVSGQLKNEPARAAGRTEERARAGGCRRAPRRFGPAITTPTGTVSRMARSRNSLRRSSSSIQSRAWAWRSRAAARSWISRTGECRSSACIASRGRDAAAGQQPQRPRRHPPQPEHQEDRDREGERRRSPRKPISSSRNGASISAAGMLAATSQPDRPVWA